MTDDLSDADAVKELAKEYQGHRENTLYRSVMNVIIKANEELFKEESGVCEAIIDLFRDEYDKGVEDAKQLGALQQIILLVRKGLLSIEDAAGELNMSVEEFGRLLME